VSTIHGRGVAFWWATSPRLGLARSTGRWQAAPEPADADEDASRERQNIEDALAGSRGRVSGPNGPQRGSEYHLRPWSTALRN
jgi:hypothetical protein